MINGLVPAPQALEIILENAVPVQSERVELKEATGRVLSDDIISLRTQPPFDASAMDGFAVRQRDIKNIPAKLKIIGQSAAGHPFTEKLNENEAVRIFTGATVPKNADTIIIQENTNYDDNFVEILSGNPPGKFIRKAGLDFKQGETLLNRHRVLDPQSVALAASMNHAKLPVWKRPVVAIMATGDELVHPGGKTKAGQIIASNTFALSAIAKMAGAQVIDLGIAKDTVEELNKLTIQAIDQGADLIITMGGASVGDHDLVKPAMEKIGFNFEFSKISMRPGKPLLFARKQHGNKTIRCLGLAGNPVSSIIAGQVFVRPLINTLAGLPSHQINPINAKLGCDLEANDERQEYMRATLVQNAIGELIATPLPNQDSSMLAGLTKADCILIRPIRAPASYAGDPCEIVHII